MANTGMTATMTTAKKTDKEHVSEAINEFFKMKDKYETAYKEKYINPLLKAKNSSKREKRVAFSKLPKAECINCKRNVGTVFAIKRDTINSDFNRKYLAKCGDVNEPCPLNININYGECFTYEDEINKNERDINKLKTDIIKEKYNMMFGYINDENAIASFEQLSSELKDSTYLAGSVMEKHILVNDNPEKTELLKRSIDIFGKEYILQFKHMMKEYNETGEELLVGEAVKFYVNEMMPRIKEIQELKYEINMVEYDLEPLAFSLYQRKNSLQNLEYSFDKGNKVVSFVKGTKEPIAKNKTLKINKLGAKSKSKTRKSIILVEEGDEDEEEEGAKELENEGLNEGLNEGIDYVPNSPPYNPESPPYNPESPVKNYTINGSNVTWDIPEYNYIWAGLTPKYRAVLLKEPDWMKDTMDYLFAAQKTPDVRRKLFFPRNTKIPPTVLEDNQLDFENDIINNLVANLAPAQREILVGELNKTENPTPEELRLFNSMLNSMLETAVGFTGLPSQRNPGTK